MYRNSEGYHDPTAGIAMGKTMREYREKRRKIWHRENSLKNRQKVYIVSKYRGDIDNNTKQAIRFCKFAIEKGKMPIASHLLYPQILNDNDENEREMGTMFGLALIKCCDEVWCLGKDLSSGMQREIKEAKRIGKKIKFFDEEKI